MKARIKYKAEKYLENENRDGPNYLSVTCINVECTKKALEAIFMQHSNKFDINECGMSYSEVIELKAIQRRNQYKIVSSQIEWNGDDLDLEC